MINNPTEILPASGCVIWLDGSNSTNFKQLSTGLTDVNNNDPVGYWRNLGSLSSTQNPVVSGHFTNIGGNNSTRPTYISSLSCLRFDGSNDYLTLSATRVHTSETAFIVFTQNVAVNNARVLTTIAAGGTDDQATAGSWVPCMRSIGANTMYFSVINGTGRPSGGFNLRQQGVFDIYSVWVSSVSGVSFLNGASSAFYPATLNYTSVLTRMGAPATTGAVLGNHFNGDICEVIVYNRALTDFERADVEYYLTRKWSVLNSIPRQVYAIRNGNWDNTDTWSVSGYGTTFGFPFSADNVYTNNFTVTANQNILVNSLRTTALAPNINTGGTFVVDQPFNINSLVGLFAGTTTCLSSVHTTGTVFLTSTTIVGGSLTNACGVINERVGSLNVIGNITGGTNATAYGIVNNSTGTVNVLSGAVLASTAGAGVVNNSTGTFIFNSPTSIVGGSGTLSYGALNNSTGSMLLSANVIGGSVAGAYGIVNNSTGNLSLSGNVTGGTTVTTAYGAFNNTTGNLTIQGNVLAAASPACWNNAAGNLTVVGNVSGAATTGVVNNSLGNVYVTAPNIIQGGTAASANGINNASAGNCYVTGNVLGGTNATARGIINTSIGAVILSGNVTANTGPGLTQSSTGTVIMDGDITASFAQNGFVSASTAARNEITGALYNSLSGMQAVFATRYLLKPKLFNSFTRMAGSSATNTPVFFYSPEAYSISFVPNASSVRIGTLYGAVSSLSGVAVNIPAQLEGTMFVPSISTVSLGTLVDNLTGVALLNPATLESVWSTTNINQTRPNTIGSRLKDIASIPDIGEQLGSINI